MWNDVELLANDDTSTVRVSFDLRRECGSALYQVDNLVKLSCSEKVLHNPDLYASYASNYIVVVADRTVVLFDYNFQSVLLDVDTVAVCHRGQFLLVGERNGNLHLVYVPQKSTVFTKVSNWLFFGENVLSQWRMHPAKNTMSISHLLDSSLMLGSCDDIVFSSHGNLLPSEVILSIHVSYCLSSCFTSCLLFPGHQFLSGFLCSYIYRQEGSSMKLVALTVPNSSQMRSLVVYSLPSMTALYSLEVSSTSALVKMGVNMDTVYLLEGISKSLKRYGKDPVSSVVVRCFTEALPENRLSRLLHKHKFEEAETFAIQFGLDVELVYKVKLDFVLEKLASSPSGGYGQEVFSELVEEAKTNLAKINDEHFVVQYSVKAPWPTFSTAQEMLNHANSRYPCSQIQEALSKLATFCGLNGPEKFNGISWIEFLQSSDYIIDILWHLRDGDLRGAQYLWLRNEPEFAEQFDEKTLDALLSSIPKDVPSKDLCPWFRTIVIPFIRKTFPKGQLSRWLEQRARNLELTEKADWPQNGLEMAQLGLPSFWLWLPLEDDCGLEEVEQLRSLVQSLRQLLDLFNKYHCKLSLSDFEKRNTRSIVFLMLDKVLAPELIPSVIESSVRPYTQEHRLHLDELLLLNIYSLTSRASMFNHIYCLNLTPTCCCHCQLVEDAVLEIMYKAVVPWSSVVEQLVQKHLEMDHPRQELLKESYQLMEIKKLLRVYGIRNFNPSSDNLAMVLVRRILKQDLPSSLEDALKVAQVYKLDTSQIYFLYIIQLISQCGRNMLLATWARLELQNKHLISEEVTHDSLRIECVNNLKMFEAIANLQEDFDIFLSPEEYADRALRAQFQEQHITAYENTKARGRLQDTRPIVANDPDGKTKTISTEAGLYRLARQLQRSEQELWADLALRALLVGKVDKALKICSELYQHHYDACTGRVLFHAAKMLCQMLEDNVPMIIPDGINLPAIIHNLACQAITVCHPDLLLDCVELCKSTRAAMDVYQQCQIDDDGFTAKESSSVMDCGPYTEWSFQNIFNEDGIVLDPVSVLPFQYKITNCLLPSFSGHSKRYPLDCSCLSNCSYKDELDFLQPLLSPVTVMLQNLQECSQLELALRLLVNTFGSSLQHIASNNIDLTLSSQVKEDRKCLSDFGNFTLNSIKTVAMALLHKVLNWRVVDCSLAIGYCTLLPQSDMLEILWKVINNTCVNGPAQLCSLYKEETQREKFLSLVTDAEWGIKLAKLGISIQPVFRQCPEMKNNLIPTLVKNRNMTAELILEYCSTFDLDCNLALSMYITTLLLEGEGESQDLVGDKGEAQTSKLSKVDAVEQALQIIPLLQSTSELAVSLNAAILKLSPYNYERIEGLLRIIENAGETIPSFPLDQAIRLLQYLKSYKRISAPGELENSYLLEQALEPTQLAQTRLPFHLLFKTGRCFWKIITPELSEQTFPTLLLISKLMKVSLDKLYMSAVNHMFERSLKPLLLEQMRQGSCSTTSKKTARIAHTIMDYVLCIKNPEWAAATAHRIAQELPPGIEKTKSLKFCLALGEKWLKVPDLETRSKGEIFMEKLKVQYQCSATENILASRNLLSPELLKLTGLPVRLLAALWEHSSVEQRMGNPAGYAYPDIHAVAKEIAAINNVDLSKVRDMMLEKWLCKTGPSVKLFTSSFLPRVVYLLQMYPMDFSSRLLSSILTAETWPLSNSRFRLTFCHRARALLCVVHIADPSTLETLLHIPRDKVQYYLKCYIHLAQLEGLNIPYTVDSFLNSPKEGLIKGLWKNHSHEPEAVRLVSDLCLEYQVFDPQLWNGVLQKLLTFNMVVYHSGGTDHNLSLFYHLRCPFLLNMDLIGIAKCFTQVNLPCFSLGSLLLISCTSKKERNIQCFLSTCDLVTVLEQVEDHMNTGELAGIPSEVWIFLLFFFDMVEYLISRKW
uniref:Kinetochore associated 1 n=1 Tax=Scleropages formosus TaxID=113540 RepID=A0A8C9TIM5_SCLFO